MKWRQMLQEHRPLRIYGIVISALVLLFMVAELIFVISLSRSGVRVYRTAVEYHLGTVVVLGLRLWVTALLPLIFLYAKNMEIRETYLLNRYVEPVAYGLFMVRYVAVLYVLTWPLELYQYLRARQWNLTHMEFGRFVGQCLGDFFIQYFCPALLVFGIIYLMRRYRKAWWKAATVVMVAILVMGQVALPWLGAAKPLDRPAYQRQAERLFEKADVKSIKIYVSSQSRDSHQINAYSQGILGSHRIVLWDTIFSELNPREVMVVLAHEIGHYKVKHAMLNTLWWMLKWFAAIMLTYVWTMRAGGRRSMKEMTRRYLSPRRLPVLLLALQLFFCLWLPLDRWISRVHERQADAMVMELVESREDAISTLRKIGNEELELPYYSRLYTCWFQDYPSMAERMAFYESYAPSQNP